MSKPSESIVPWSQLPSTCYYTIQKDSCPWECSAGYFLMPAPLTASGGQCQPCSTGACPVGYYRTLCAPTADSTCQPCANAHPPYTHYNTDGGDAASSQHGAYFDGACGWACNAGYYAQALLPKDTCDGAPLSPARCVKCGNKPVNAYYTGPGMTLDWAVCPWACNASLGLYSNGTACLPFTPGACTADSTAIGLDGQRPAIQPDTSPCYFPALRAANGTGGPGARAIYFENGPGAANVSGCYPWQFVDCSTSVAACRTCDGATTAIVGGQTAYSFDACAVGYYRAPCKPGCVFPLDGLARGPCVPCANAQTDNANYTAAGSAATAYSCAWDCLDGFVKRNLTRQFGNVCVRLREACLPVSALPEPGPCNSSTWTATLAYTGEVYYLTCGRT